MLPTKKLTPRQRRKLIVLKLRLWQSFAPMVGMPITAKTREYISGMAWYHCVIYDRLHKSKKRRPRKVYKPIHCVKIGIDRQGKPIITVTRDKHVQYGIFVWERAAQKFLAALKETQKQLTEA